MVQTVGYLHGVEFPAVGDVAAGVDYGIEGDSLTGTADITTPDTPTFTTVTGANSVTLTIDGEAGVTHEVIYKASSDTDWLDGGSRVGDGDVTVSSLDNDVPYIFTVYSVDGATNSSTPGVAVNITLSVDATNEIDDDLDNMAEIQLDTHGEPVVYWPRGGGSRAIVVLVDRVDGEVTNVWAANDSTIGITTSEADTGGDTIEIATRIGRTKVKRRILHIGPQDAGLVRYDLVEFNPDLVGVL